MKSQTNESTSTVYYLAASLLLAGVAATSIAQPGLDGMADADGDGSISKEEFLARRSALFPTLDSDESGGLSKEEFSVALEDTPLYRFRGRAFGRADGNGDGEISQEEWDSLPTRAFDRLDRNDDGTIDESERPERAS